MTWEELLTLQGPAFHATIAEQVYGWQPLPDAKVRAATGCTHTAPDGGLYSIPDYTGDWGETMALVWRKRIGLGVTHEPGVWICSAEQCPGAFPLYAHTEEEARLALCRLALWRALQEETKL